jgi:hypothetical protein
MIPKFLSNKSKDITITCIQILIRLPRMTLLSTNRSNMKRVELRSKTQSSCRNLKLSTKGRTQRKCWTLTKWRCSTALPDLTRVLMCSWGTTSCSRVLRLMWQGLTIRRQGTSRSWHRCLECCRWASYSSSSWESRSLQLWASQFLSSTQKFSRTSGYGVSQHSCLATPFSRV